MNPSRRSARWAATALGVLGALGLALLLWRPFTLGMSQSYDTALYARSMWGVAHGDPYNPVYGTHWLGVHANGLLWFSAPLTRWLAAWKVLVLSQSVAFGFTVALLFSASFRALAPLIAPDPCGARGSIPRVGVAVAAVWVMAALVGAPLLINPFLFDARPDLVAVPLLLAGLLRAQRRGAWDARSFLWLVAAALVREEFAAIGAASLVLSPPNRVAQSASSGSVSSRAVGLSAAPWTLRGRVLGAAALGAWFCIYWWGVRPGLLDGNAAARATQAAEDLFATTGSDVGAFRAALALATCAFGGGFALRGWRWLGPAVPGLVFVALSSKMADQALNFHYPMFAAPALALASIAGLGAFAEAAARKERRRAAWVTLAASTLLAAGVSGALGAHPLGARFKAEHFAADPEARAWQQECHALLGTIPPDEGTAVASMFGGPFSDRSAAWSLETLVARLRAGGDLPPEVAWVVVDNARFGSLGRVLVNAQGMRLHAIAAGRIALFGRPASADAPPPILGNTVPLRECVSREVAWEDAGIVLCDLERLADQRLAAVVFRDAPRSADARPLALHAEVNGAGIQLSALSGLIDLSTLSVGQGVRVVSAEPVRAAGARFHLSDMDGRAFEGHAASRGEGRAERRLGVERMLPQASPIAP